jgi:hypothetical protein
MRQDIVERPKGRKSKGTRNRTRLGELISVHCRILAVMCQIETSDETVSPQSSPSLFSNFRAVLDLVLLRGV